jgi:hypothetical protein
MPFAAEAETETARASEKRFSPTISITCALVVALLVFLFHVPFGKSDYLLNDSADYLRAAHAPFSGTYLNTDSASPAQLFALRNDKVFRSHPWDYLYARGDNASLRHFHSPLSFYPMHAVAVLTPHDRYQRMLSSAVTALTCGVIAYGLIAFQAPVVLAFVLALVAGVQSRYIEVSIDPSPHGWYMLFAVLFLFSFAWYMRDRRFSVLALSSIFLAFAFATLEFSLELVVSVPFALACLWIMQRRSLADLKTLILSLLKAIPVFCFATFLLWPGGWLRGGYLESYGVTGATLLLKNNAAFGERLTAQDLYHKLFATHEALLLLLIFFTLASLILLVRRKLSVATVVFCAYTVVAFGLGVADHFRLDTYISETLLFLFVSSALLLGDVFSNMAAGARRIAMSASVALLLVIGLQEIFAHQPIVLYQPLIKPVLVGVAAEVPPGNSILVNDNWEAYSLYLPQYQFEQTTSKTDLTPRSAERAKGIRYFLFDDSAPPISNATLLRTLPSYLPGHTVNLFLEH